MNPHKPITYLYQLLAFCHTGGPQLDDGGHVENIVKLKKCNMCT